MAGDPDMRAILEALHATRASARERQKTMERNIRQEAARLAPGKEGEAVGEQHASVA